MTKKELVAKIAKEQGLDEKKLMKLPVVELEKMDKVVPDDGGDLLGADSVPSELPKVDGAETSSEGHSDTESEDSESAGDTDGETDEEGAESDASSESEPVEGKVIGYHPVTGKPVVE